MELTKRLEAKLSGVGDPDKDMGEMLARNVTVECIKEEVQDLKDKLAVIEDVKEMLVAADGENAELWGRRLETEAKAKYRAAMLRGREGIRERESASPPVTPGPHSVSSKSSTRREVVSLPDFAGAEKAGNSPFLDFPVWLRNWQEHIVDYEAKSW